MKPDLKQKDDDESGRVFDKVGRQGIEGVPELEELGDAHAQATLL